MYPGFFLGFGLGLADELVDARGAHHGDALDPTAARDLLGRPQALLEVLRGAPPLCALTVALELAADDRFVAP